MSAKPYSAAFLTLLMLASSFIIIFPIKAQPAQGDWVVTGNEVVSDQVIVLNGNLTVKAGGSLTLTNVTLTMVCQYRGQHGILVEQGGQMFIYRSRISAMSLDNIDNRYTFVVKSDGFVMKESELHGVGWSIYPIPEDYWYGMDDPVGLTLEGANVVIENNNISYDFFGVGVFNSNAVIKNNYFDHIGYEVMNIQGSDELIVGNVMTQELLTAAIGAGGNNITIDNNRMAHTAGIGIGGWNCTITNNFIDGDGIGGQLSNSIISGNVITNSSEVGIAIDEGVNDLIQGNIIMGGGSIRLFPVYKCVIANNSLFNTSQIHLDHSNNNSILNNMIYGNGLFLFGAKDNMISGNNISQQVFLYGGSDGNVLTNNDVNAQKIVLCGSSSNTIFNNNLGLTNNLSGYIYDDGGNNWELNGTGNYWGSLYSGLDANRDGIGDVPFIIHPNGTDYCPLMQRHLTTFIPIPTFAPVSASEGPGGPEQHFQWNSSVLAIENQVLNLERGGIGIPPGGTLIIRNSTLILGARGVFVISLGFEDYDNRSLIIENSILRRADNGYAFSISGNNLESVVIRNSTLDGVTWGNGGGLAIGNAHSMVVENSIITGSFRALFLNGVDSLLIANNTFYSNLHTLSLDGPNMTIVGNIFRDAVWDCIDISGGLSYPDHYILISNNTILKSWGAGIAIEYADSRINATISDNTIMNCNGGVWASTGSVFYHNNLMNNTPQAGSTGGAIWDFNGEGNFWSDYQGKDANLDGIGDSPYNGNNFIDNFPLMQQNGWQISLYLTVKTNCSSVPFYINGTRFTTGPDGTVTLKLGYIASYDLSFSQNTPMPDGSSLNFVKWGDGSTNPSRIMALSSNITVSADLASQPPSLLSGILGTYLIIVIVIGIVAVTAIVLIVRRRQSPK